MPPVAGVGYLIVNDILTDAAFTLIEPSVKTAFPAGIAAGAQAIPVFDLAMYLGCKLVVGAGASLEVVTVTAVVVGTSFSANFTQAHSINEPIVGATFPVRQPEDPFFTQAEMLGYVATAVNDYLGDCALVIAISSGITVAPTLQTTALPADCQKPVRVGAYGIPLRESSQSNLDSMDYRWQQNAATGPFAYFRDKLALLTLGIFPRANNTTPLEIVYEQRGPQAVGLADGFILPDPFLMYVKYRVLEYAYSKDGEQRNPGLARYYNGRYMAGVKIGSMFLEAVMDPNLAMAQ